MGRLAVEQTSKSFGSDSCCGSPILEAMGIARDLEKIRKIRRRLMNGKPMMMIPESDAEKGENGVTEKMIGTLALGFNHEAMQVMVKFFGVSKRATVPALEVQVPLPHFLGIMSSIASASKELIRMHLILGQQIVRVVAA